MENKNKISKELALETIITPAVQIPGVRVDRNKFLAEIFVNEDVEIQDVLDFGTVQAGCTKEQLARISNKLILKRTSESSIASFVSGIPGGFAMAATIPADVMQFFGMTLRLAQEISYLYGADDLWQDGQVNEEQIKNQLIMYCGVMFGVSGAATGVRVLTTQIAKTTLKKLPQKALTKTFWYPIIKQIGKAIGVKVTKTTVANGVGKIIPIIGGVISGGLNFASMLPMANRLQSTLEMAVFDYTEEKFVADIEEIESIDESENNTETKEFIPVKDKISKSIKNAKGGLSSVFAKRSTAPNDSEDVFAKIEKLAELKESSIITEQEFEEKKKELLAKV